MDYLPDVVPPTDSTLRMDDRKQLMLNKDGRFLEMESVHAYSTTNEYMYAMKEDLAEWLKSMYLVNISADNFMQTLENGSLLCQHANHVVSVSEQAHCKQDIMKLSRATLKNRKPPSKENLIPAQKIPYRCDAKPQSFAARDNVSNFIRWARSCAGVRECLMFETDDLIMRKNEKNFILCVLEVARYGSQFGVEVPKLVKFEEEIANEEKRDFKSFTQLRHEQSSENNMGSPSWLSRAMRSLRHIPTSHDIKSKQRQDTVETILPSVATDNLQPLVTELVNRCSCKEKKLSAKRIGDGKYIFSGAKVNQVLYIRLLRSHIMVNVGNNWDTLENFLNQKDPCRSGHGYASDPSGNQGGQMGNLPPDELAFDKDSLCEDGSTCENSAQCPPTSVKSYGNPRHGDALQRSCSEISLNLWSDSCYATSACGDPSSNATKRSTPPNGSQLPPLQRHSMKKYTTKAKTTQLLGLEHPRVLVTDYDSGLTEHYNDLDVLIQKTIPTPNDRMGSLEYFDDDTYVNYNDSDGNTVFDESKDLGSMDQETFDGLEGHRQPDNDHFTSSVIYDSEKSDFTNANESAQNDGADANSIDSLDQIAGSFDEKNDTNDNAEKEDDTDNSTVSLEEETSTSYINPDKVVDEHHINNKFVSRLPRLTARDVSGTPVPHRLVLKNRRSRSLQLNEDEESSNTEFSDIPQSSTSPRVIHKYGCDGRRPATDRLVSNASHSSYIGHRSPVEAISRDYRTASGGTSNNTRNMTGTIEAAAYRENRAYMWRKKALVFRNYMKNHVSKDERVVCENNLQHNFHYPDLRGSELIYGDCRETSATTNQQHSASVGNQRLASLRRTINVSTPTKQSGETSQRDSSDGDNFFQYDIL